MFVSIAKDGVLIAAVALLAACGDDHPNSQAAEAGYTAAQIGHMWVGKPASLLISRESVYRRPFVLPGGRDGGEIIMIRDNECFRYWYSDPDGIIRHWSYEGTCK